MFKGGPMAHRKIFNLSKIRSKFNQTKKKAEKETDSLNKIKKDLVSAYRMEISCLKAKKFPSKSTQSYKNHQKKIKKLQSEMKTMNKSFKLKSA